MWKSLWPVLIHRLVLLALSFIAAKYVFAADVAHKLMAGDTVTLWAGAPAITLQDIENYLLLVGIPTLLSFIIAGWGRIKAKYALIRARKITTSMTSNEVKNIVDQSSVRQIIDTVKANP